MKNIASKPIQNYIPFVLEKNRNSLRERRRFFWKEDLCVHVLALYLKFPWNEMNWTGETEHDLSMKVPGLQYLFSVCNVVQAQNNWRSRKCRNKVIGRIHLEVYQSDLFIKREKSKVSIWNMSGSELAPCSLASLFCFGGVLRQWWFQ